MARTSNRNNLTDAKVKGQKPQQRTYLIYDLQVPRLAMLVQPTGRKSWVLNYSVRGRPRWLTLGAAYVFGVAEARRRARVLLGQVADGRDPQAERTGGNPQLRTPRQLAPLPAGPDIVPDARIAGRRPAGGVDVEKQHPQVGDGFE